MPGRPNGSSGREKQATDASNRLKRFKWLLGPTGWLSVLAAGALTGAFVLVSLELEKSDPATWQLAAPRNGYNGALAKYQAAFARLRSELTLAAASSAIYPEDLRATARSLGEVAQQLNMADTEALKSAQLPTFKQAVERIVALQVTLDVMVSKQNLNRDDAMRMLIEVESMDSTLSRLVDKVAEEELEQREVAQRGIRSRRSLVWGVMALTWLLVVGWVGSITIYSAMRREAERARLAALEAERQAVRDKEEALQAKSRFLSSISHELRSALQSMGSALEMLDQAESPQKKRALIDRIQRATAALGTQLRDLLTVARGEAGKLEMSPAPFEACEVVQEVCEEYLEAAAAKGLTLVVRTPDDPIYVVADHARIAQILNNLVSNAVKYTEKGSVTITLAPFDEVLGRLRLSVRDTGPGIPKQFLETIFKQYERVGGVDRSTDSAGIGLAVVQTLVSALSARLRVSSLEGKGTEFAVEIPVMTQQEDESAHNGDVQVLVVDDQADLLEGLAETARALGANVETANSAATAANWMATKKFDLVLVDLDMPYKTGVELASEIRRGDGLNRDSRLIAISAADRKSVGAGWPFDGFREKPILTEAWKQLLASVHDEDA